MGPYVTMVFAIFLIVFTSMTIQSQVNPVPEGSETENQQNASSSGNFAATIASCKNTSESTAKIHQFYPITGMIWRGGSTEDEVMIDDDELTDYIQRRENVPIPQIEFLGGAKFRHLQQIKDQVTLDGKKYEVYFPVKSGEFQGLEGLYKSKTRCEDPNDDSKCKEQHQIYFVDYELVFLRHLDESGFPIIVPGTATEGKEYNLADIYQSVKSVSDPEVGKLPDEAFDCSSLGETPSQSSSSQPNPTPQAPQLRVVVPEQQNSGDNTQLQLQWFAFSQSAGDEPLIPQPIPQLAFEIGCKPAVYLYPPAKQLVNVKVSPKGFLTYTDPVYDLKTGWTVEAYPDGKIYDSRYATYDKSFNYLYYESKIRDEFVYKPTKGWVIQSSVFSGSTSSPLSPQSSEWFGPMEDKFNQLLPQLGLNTLQTKDFIEYWKKALPYSPYYFIGIMDQDNIDQFEPLTITPKPDSINRVRIYFEKLDHPKQVEAPEIDDQRTSELVNQTLDPDSPIHQSTNSLFRVVEWGGMIKNDPSHPFTCSQ